MKKTVVYRTGPVAIEDMERSVCFICAAEHPPIWAISECSHRVCSLCCLRMRSLYGTRQCSMCKSASDRVIMVRAQVKDGSDHTKNFEELWNESLPKGELGMYFVDEQIKREVLQTLELRCHVPKCREGKKVWSTKQELKHHVHNAHQLSFCDICLAHKKVFPSEYKAFNRSDLVKHQQDKVSGHPSCTVCNQLFYSEDELTAHCREKHEQCHICQRQRGGRPCYHRNYEALEEHFRKEHYLCPESLCLELKFVVFETELEYKTHMAEVHMSNLKMQRSEQRQFRRIDTGFSIGSERQQRGDRRRENERGRERERDEEERFTPTPPQSPSPSNQPLARNVLRHFVYGEAIGDLAQKLQSLSMYEQRNIDFCESLQKEYKVTEGNVGTFKGYCRQFQKGEISAWDLTLKLEVMLGSERLEQISPILIDLQLDALKRMQLSSAIKAHLQKIAAFPPLPTSSDPEYLSRKNVESKSPRSFQSGPPPAVFRIKPVSQTTAYPGRFVDPSKNPLALLGASSSLGSDRSSSSLRSDRSSSKKTTKIPPSFRQAIATSSSTGIVEDRREQSTSPMIDEQEFPPLIKQSPSKTTQSAGNVFARNEDRNEPESFVIGSPTDADGFESRRNDAFESMRDGVFESDKDGSVLSNASSTSGKTRKKKGQVLLRYG